MDTLETEQIKRDRKLVLRARQLALAALNRAKEANIPLDCLRIKEDQFLSFLDFNFHGGEAEARKFASLVYNEPSFLLSRKFISIDGGDFSSRNKAGYALLFRMIAYEKTGMYYGCGELVHKFQTFGSASEMTRNDLVDLLKEYEVLFIGEFDRKIFRPHFESKEFFDEFLEYRINFNKPTIVSCTSSIEEKTDIEKAASGKLVSDCGRYLQDLEVTHKTTNEVLRIRVGK